MAVAPDFHADFLTTEIFYIPADASGASESFLFFVFISNQIKKVMVTRIAKNVISAAT